MRARAVAVGVLARPSASKVFLLVCLLAGATLLGAPAPAWAEGSVSFLQMSAERCTDSGECTWKLSCGVGGPQETEMILGGRAKTKYKLDINRTLPVQSFPATVHCTAWEDDGWFSTTWEKVGTASVELPAGGDYKLDISSKEQGTVRVLMAVDSLEMGTAAPAAAAAAKPGGPPKKAAAKTPAKAPAPMQYLGVFNAQKQGHAVLIGMEWKPFKEKVDRLAGEGLQIDDIETFEQGGKRLWSGIFHNSQDQVQLIADQDWDKFSSSWKKLTGGRMRLTDMEVYASSGKTFFAGIFRDLGESHSLWVGQPRKDFEAKVKELASFKGQQLLDFEVYRTAGGLLYAGPFRQDSVETHFWTGLNRAAFDAKVKGLRGKEWQLVDVETYKEGKERIYEALVRNAGGPGELVMGADAATFARRWRELVAKGLRLVSLEIYEE